MQVLMKVKNESTCLTYKYEIPNAGNQQSCTGSPSLGILHHSTLAIVGRLDINGCSTSPALSDAGAFFQVSLCWIHTCIARIDCHTAALFLYSYSNIDKFYEGHRQSRYGFVVWLLGVYGPPSAIW